LATARAQDNKKEEDERYNLYAREVNRIVQGQRQGAYTVEEASNRIRALDDNMFALGGDPVTMGKIRSKYDGGVYATVEAVQKEQEMHEAKRDLDSLDAYRNRYSYMGTWSDSKVKAVRDEMNELSDKIYNLQQQKNNLSLSENDRANINAMLEDTYVKYGINSTMQETFKRMSEHPDKAITATDLINVRNSLMNDIVSSGGSVEQAAVLADTIIKATGLDTVVNMIQQDSEHAAQYYKSITEHAENMAWAQAIDMFPYLAVFKQMPAEMRTELLKNPSMQKAFDMASRGIIDYDSDNQWFTYFGNPVENREFSQILTASLNNSYRAATDSMYTNKLFVNGVKTNLNMGEHYAQQAMTMTGLRPEDLEKTMGNVSQIAHGINMAVQNGSGRFSDKELKEVNNRVEELKWIGHYSDRHKPHAQILAQISETARKGGIRMRDDGTLAMLKDHESYSTWNSLSDTHQLCEEFNNSVAGLSPEVKKGIIAKYTEGVLPYNKNTDGELDDMTPQWRDQFKSALPRTAKTVKDFIIDSTKGQPRQEGDEPRIDFMRAPSSVKKQLREQNGQPEKVTSSTISGSETLAFRDMLPVDKLERNIQQYDRWIQELMERDEEDWTNEINDLRQKQNELIKERLKYEKEEEEQPAQQPLSSEYKTIIDSSAKQYGVEPELVDAIAMKESSRGKNIVSKDGGAIGVMQVRKPALTDAINAGVVPASTKLEDLKDPSIGAKVGVWYFSQMLNTFDNDEVKALAAYNQGPSWVKAAIRHAKNKDNWLEEAASNGFTIGRKRVTPQYVRSVVMDYIRPILRERDRV